MKSLCIKTNNSNTINYLLDELENLNIDDVFFVCKKFKSYNNIIIHYRGDCEELFLKEISTCLSYLVINIFEESIIKSIIEKEYFYFNKYEINQVLNNCTQFLYDNSDFSFDNRLIMLFDNIYDFISTNRNIYLSGFITFRLSKYISFLDDVVTTAVNKYIIEREYIEFISLLKIYVKSNCPTTNIIHLIYSNSSVSLLDEDLTLINLNDYELDSKYLSDISFSSNDYVLNALLNILPKQIIIHTDNSLSDDFINTLKLIFENRIKVEAI